jgi:hypothetical protein
MKKPLDPNSHAVLDYALGAGCVTIPAMAGFNTISSIASYAVGIAQIGMSLCTNYPVSVVKAIPFKVHSMIELGTAVGLIAAPLIPKLLDAKSKTFFFSSGITLLGVYLLTDYSDQAVQVAEQEFTDMRQHAMESVEHFVEEIEHQVPQPVADLLRKAS